MAELTTLTAVTVISEAEETADAVKQPRQKKQPDGRRRISKTAEEDALEAAAQLEDELVPESVLDVDVVGLHKPDYTNPQISNHKAKFEEWLFKKYEKKGTSLVCRRAELDFVKVSRFFCNLN